MVSLRNKFGRGRAQRRQQGQLRIIGGSWRSRRIRFPHETGIRPTPDRVRETLFNWLREEIPGARCLDLYAGSGALGFEALSRGAAHVTFVDEDVRVIQQLRTNFTILECEDAAEAIWSDAMAYLDAGHGGPFDVVFLDPPFRDRILTELCERLERSRLLAPAAWIYLESDCRQPLPQLPGTWRYAQNRTAGQVGYHLCRREAP